MREAPFPGTDLRTGTGTSTRYKLMVGTLLWEYNYRAEVPFPATIVVRDRHPNILPHRQEGR